MTPISPAVILVVDDEPDLRDLLEFLLLREGYEVICLSDGDAALAWLDRHPADLVLTDIMMPGMDGLTLARAIRYREHLAAMPIMAMSAVPHLVLREESEIFDTVIHKPFLGADLLAQIRSLLLRRA